MALGVEEQVLGFEIAVGHALAVQVRHASEDLLEAALDLAGRHAASLDRRVEVSSRTELHDFAPMLGLVLDEIDRLDDVDMVQC